jgi:hypothetical protein
VLAGGKIELSNQFACDNCLPKLPRTSALTELFSYEAADQYEETKSELQVCEALLYILIRVSWLFHMFVWWSTNHHAALEDITNLLDWRQGLSPRRNPTNVWIGLTREFAINL